MSNAMQRAKLLFLVCYISIDLQLQNRGRTSSFPQTPSPIAITLAMLALSDECGSCPARIAVRWCQEERRASVALRNKLGHSTSMLTSMGMPLDQACRG